MYAHKLRNSPRNAIGVERVNQHGGCEPKGTLNPYNDDDKDVGPRATMNILYTKRDMKINDKKSRASGRARTQHARMHKVACGVLIPSLRHAPRL